MKFIALISTLMLNTDVIFRQRSELLAVQGL